MVPTHPQDRDRAEPFVQKNADGHLEVFAPGHEACCHRWQARWREGPTRVVWRHPGWHEKPQPQPEVGLTWLEAALNWTNPLAVLALGDDGALWHAWQVNEPPFWSTWERLGSPPAQIRAADRLTIGTHQDGRLEVFVVGQDGAVWHIWPIRSRYFVGGATRTCLTGPQG